MFGATSMRTPRGGYGQRPADRMLREARPRQCAAAEPRSVPLAQGRPIPEEADALLDAIRAGDSGALAMLYDQAGGQAYGLAYRILRDAGAAEDAVQEAFLSLWRHAGRLDASRGRLVSYLLTLVHHKAIDLARMRAGRAARDSGTDPADAGAIEDDFVSDVLAAADGRVLRESLGRLPGEQRRPIELAYFDGLTCPEIAQAERVPVGTIKSRLRLGLQKLRSDLERQGYP